MDLEFQLFQSMQLMTKHGVDDDDDCTSLVPLPEMCSHKSQNPRMVWIGKDSKDHLVPSYPRCYSLDQVVQSAIPT